MKSILNNNCDRPSPLILLLLFGFCIALAACDKKPPDVAASPSVISPTPPPPPAPEMTQDERDIEDAKKCVTSKLNDPSSAQFKEILVVNGSVIGQVNARNQFGGYSDFQFFCWVRPGAKPPSGFNPDICCYR